MTSVAYGSLVEVCDAPRRDGSHPVVRLVEVERVAVGDYVAHPYGGVPLRVQRVVHHATDGSWGLTTYMGLRADGMQMILVGGQMMRVCTWGEGVVQPCAGLVSLALERDHVARIDGVVCMTIPPDRTVAVAPPRVEAYERVRVRFGERCHETHAAGKDEWMEASSPTGIIPARPGSWCNVEPRVHTRRDGA